MSMAAPATTREAALRRRRRPGLWAAGTALVAVGGLGAAALVGQAGDRVEVLAVARTVPVGQTIGGQDVTVARVAADPALRPVPAAERDQVVGRVAAVELRPGSLVTAGEVTDDAVPRAGEQVVGVATGPGQMPARGLRPGIESSSCRCPGITPARVGPATRERSRRVRRCRRGWCRRVRWTSTACPSSMWWWRGRWVPGWPRWRRPARWR